MAVDPEYLTAHNVGNWAMLLHHMVDFASSRPSVTKHSSNIDIRGLAVSHTLQCQVRLCGYVVSGRAPPQPQVRQTS